MDRGEALVRCPVFLEVPNMSAARTNAVRLASLALLVACASGCGTDNPMAPTAAALEVRNETAVAAMPIESDPGSSDVVAPPTIIAQPQPQPLESKRKENPGNRRGWYKNH